jgi:hypothetical protein
MTPMPPLKSLLLFAALAALPFAAQAASPVETLEQLKNQAVFCEGTYALCIKAPCVPIPTMDRLGNFTIDKAACSCTIESGWSMGPGQCADRRPVTQNGHAFMISTYSNKFNARNDSLKTTLACNTSTPWAWCYGAACVVDENSPAHTATCTCPLQTGPMQTLGGNCNADNCKFIWSAATPGGDNGANQIFASYMQRNGYPHSPPAEMCTGTPAAK